MDRFDSTFSGTAEYAGGGALPTPATWSSLVLPAPPRAAELVVDRPVARAERLALGVPSLRAKVPKLVLVVAAVTTLAWVISTPAQHPLNYYLSVAWSLYLPIALIGAVGAVRSRSGGTTRFAGRVDNPVVFVIPSVARHDTLPALNRVIDSVLAYAPARLEHFRVHVVVEAGAEALPELRAREADQPLLEILVVPAGYATPRGTKHKARANHYAMEARTRRRLNADDMFVYHLDDDTGVGPDTIASIAEFIHHDDGTCHLAQGVLAFPRQLAASRLTWLADAVRPADDLTRFQFFTGILGRPLGGLHGEHLLVRASIEEDVGWDFGVTKVEDAHFAFKYATGGYGRSTFLRSCTYGASPETVRDFIKQRRRWAGGLVKLMFLRSKLGIGRLPLVYQVSLWSMGLFKHLGVVLLVALIVAAPGTSPVAKWLVPVWSVGLGFLLWTYLEGLRVNLEASGEPRRYLPTAILIIPAVWVFVFLEAFAAALGVKDALLGNDNFTVIAKQR